MSKHITYIISDIDKAIAFEWIAENLDPKRFRLSLILLNPGHSHLETWWRKNQLLVKRIVVRGKRDYPKAFLRLIWILMQWKPDVVHTHLQAATILGLQAAKYLGIRQRLYTRHHSTFHHDFFPSAVKRDLRVNAIATQVVAISQNVARVLTEMEKVPASKVALIHHGFNLEAFDQVPVERVNGLRQRYLPDNVGPVIGVIARYIDWKGHRYAVSAFKTILDDYPRAHFIFANANGPHRQAIGELIRAHLPESHVTEIAFEPDLFALYQLFDVYVHVPIDTRIEAFGQTYVEALAAGIPSIFTLSGVAPEFVRDGYNALVVPYQDAGAISEAIEKLIRDQGLRAQLIRHGKESVAPFGLAAYIEDLETLYG